MLAAVRASAEVTGRGPRSVDRLNACLYLASCAEHLQMAHVNKSQRTQLALHKLELRICFAVLRTLMR